MIKKFNFTFNFILYKFVCTFETFIVVCMRYFWPHRTIIWRSIQSYQQQGYLLSISMLFFIEPVLIVLVFSSAKRRENCDLQLGLFSAMGKQTSKFLRGESYWNKNLLPIFELRISRSKRKLMWLFSHYLLSNSFLKRW